jgi:BolA protein
MADGIGSHLRTDKKLLPIVLSRYPDSGSREAYPFLIQQATPGALKMGFSETISEKIRKSLAPLSLEIANESQLHKGHQESFDGSGETHLRIRVVAEKFEKMSRVERHRLINALVAEEISQGLHAIAIEARAPSEIR